MPFKSKLKVASSSQLLRDISVDALGGALLGGGVGAGTGAVAAGPEHRREGALRGALIGAGTGAVGGGLIGGGLSRSNRTAASTAPLPAGVSLTDAFRAGLADRVDVTPVEDVLANAGHLVGAGGALVAAPAAAYRLRNQPEEEKVASAATLPPTQLLESYGETMLKAASASSYIKPVTTGSLIGGLSGGALGFLAPKEDVDRGPGAIAGATTGAITGGLGFGLIHRQPFRPISLAQADGANALADDALAELARRYPSPRNEHRIRSFPDNVVPLASRKSDDELFDVTRRGISEMSNAVAEGRRALPSSDGLGIGPGLTIATLGPTVAAPAAALTVAGIRRKNRAGEENEQEDITKTSAPRWKQLMRAGELGGSDVGRLTGSGVLDYKKEIAGLEEGTNRLAERFGVTQREGTVQGLLSGGADLLRGKGVDRLKAEAGTAGVAFAGGGYATLPATMSTYAAPWVSPLMRGARGDVRKGVDALARRHEIDEARAFVAKRNADVEAITRGKEPASPQLFVPGKLPRNLRDRVSVGMLDAQRKMLDFGASRAEGMDQIRDAALLGLPKAKGTLPAGRHISPDVILRESRNVATLPEGVKEQMSKFRMGEEDTLGPLGFSYGKESTPQQRAAILDAFSKGRI